MTIEFGNNYILYIIGIVLIVIAVLCMATKVVKFGVTLLIVAAIFIYGGSLIDNVKENYGSGEMLLDGKGGFDFDSERFASDVKNFITNISIGNINEIQSIEIIATDNKDNEEIFLNIIYKNEETEDIEVDIQTYEKIKKIIEDFKNIKTIKIEENEEKITLSITYEDNSTKERVIDIETFEELQGVLEEIENIKTIKIKNTEEFIDEINLNITYKDKSTKEVTVDVPTYNKLKELLGPKFKEGTSIINKYSN